jgi:phosphatidylinositol alpha-1,6-mannosyltransferase
MKLLMLTENWPPQVGGIENYLWHIAHFLALNGHEISVIAPKVGREMRVNKNEAEVKGQRDNSWSNVNFQKGTGSKEVKVIKKRFYGHLLRPRWWGLYRRISKLAGKERYDAVLCGKGLFEGMVGYLLKRKWGMPYAIFTYGMEIESWKKSWRENRKLYKVSQEASIVFCINDLTKDSLVSLGIDEKKIIKAWPGVDQAMFKHIAEEDILGVLKKYEIRRPYIISVGRLIERKGFDVLIESFAKLDQTQFGNAQLVIVGDGPQLAELQNSVERELIDSSVLFLPEVPNEDLPALYAGAMLFAMTPRDLAGDIEGFGLVYLEAAAQGTPAVGTRTGGVPEAVIDGGTGILVEPEEIGAIKTAMAKIIMDNKFRAKLSVAAKNRVIQEFSWSERIKVIEKGIQGMAESRKV